MLSFDQCVEKIKDEKRTLMIASPRYKGFSDDYADSLNATIVLCFGLGIRLIVHRSYAITLADMSRGLIMDQALKHPVTDCLMIDQDMGWNPDDVIRLWANDKGVVAGVGRRKGTMESNNAGGYAVKFLTAEGVVRKENMLGHELRFPVDTEDGTMEVEGVGAAFMRIRLSAYEKMIANYPELIARMAITGPGGQVERMLVPHLFKQDIFDGDILAEDYSFCHRWRDMGEKIWVDPTIKLRHWGEHCWEGALIEGFKVRPKEAADVAAG